MTGYHDDRPKQAPAGPRIRTLAALVALAWTLGCGLPAQGQGLGPGFPGPTLQAAQRGEAAAQFEMGERYLYGSRDVPQDTAQGLSWLRKAAAQGHLQAISSLARVYEMGRLVARDDAQALSWYRQAAAHPAPSDTEARIRAAAQFQLGTMLIEGRGAPRDAVEGLALLEQAAGTGLQPYFQSLLGQYYLEGRGIARDEGKALSWFRRAADNNDAQGQWALGKAYAEGRLVPVDKKESVRWTLAAAQRGTYQARLPLALAYHRGEGVARDPAAAHLWALKAKEVSIPVPAVDALLKELEKDMTPGQVAAARDEAAAYRFIR